MNKQGLYRQYSGYSLLELIVVLSMLGLISSLTIPYVGQSIDKFRVKDTAYDIFNSLKVVRQEAIVNQAEKVFILDIEKEEYHAASVLKRYNLPEEVEFTFITAESELLNTKAGQIRFFLDGSSTGGRITLAFRQQSYEINIDWLTGQITMKN